jgi:glycerol-3-phosphate dehydrogenase (NAD(P)+)
MDLRFGIIGSGSWATALVKILTDNQQKVNWWIRNSPVIEQIKNRRHNPQYLSSAYFDISLLTMSDNIRNIVERSDVLVLAVPSAYIKVVLEALPKSSFQNKKIISAIKGLVPEQDVLLNEYLA